MQKKWPGGNLLGDVEGVIPGLTRQAGHAYPAQRIDSSRLSVYDSDSFSAVARSVCRTVS